jgi:hypothetical protein
MWPLVFGVWRLVFGGAEPILWGAGNALLIPFDTEEFLFIRSI